VLGEDADRKDVGRNRLEPWEPQKRPAEPRRLAGAAAGVLPGEDRLQDEPMHELLE
jgi:hypothetical protein